MRISCTRDRRRRRDRSLRRAPRRAGADATFPGMWSQRFHEDLPERGAGPEIGDYTGLPINDAARLRADSWNAAKWTMPERQCEPHPADYGPRGPAALRIASTVDPISQDVISWNVTVMWMLPQRTIYMDGRPRPSPNAQHSWQGFSTGEWEGDMLKVTTTHLKEGWVRRNGLPRSDKATLARVLHSQRELPDARHGRERSRVSDGAARAHVGLGARSGLAAQPVLVHSGHRDRAAARHGAASLAGHESVSRRSIAVKHGLPLEAARGGAATMYPEYVPQLSRGAGAAR